MTVYEIITERILESLKNGLIPWRQPGEPGRAYRWSVNKLYRGINQIMLERGEYATTKQIYSAGGRLKKKEKSHIVTFFKMIEKEDKAESYPVLRYYRVYEINTQCEGLSSKRAHAPEVCLLDAEKIVKGYADCPRIAHRKSRSYYEPTIDTIIIPPKEQFNNTESYYLTLFHELVHSTGHEKRLNRATLTEETAFGGKFNKEELIAEIGAALLCTTAGMYMPNLAIDEDFYRKGWIHFLTNSNPQTLVRAAGAAQKAVDWILGIQLEATEPEA